MAQLLQALVNGLTSAGLYALLALGLTLAFGVARVVNFAHGDFIAVGGLVAASIIGARASSFGEFAAAVAIACAVCALIALIAERSIFRGAHKDAATALVVSIGLTFVLQNALTRIWGTEGRVLPPVLSRTFQVAGARVQGSSLLILGIALTAVLVYFAVLRWTNIGSVWRAMSQDSEAAELLGIHTARHRTANFVLGTTLAGLAGGLLLLTTPVTPLTGAPYLAITFAAVIVGGLGHPIGALVGAAMVGLTQSFAGAYVGTRYINVVAMLVIVVVLVIRPTGIWGEEETL